MEVAARVLLGDVSGELCTKDIDPDRLAHSYHEASTTRFAFCSTNRPSLVYIYIMCVQSSNFEHRCGW